MTKLLKNIEKNKSIEEVAEIVKIYLKEKYPRYKFSVKGITYFLWEQSVYITLIESPVEIYKKFDELTDEDFRKIALALFPLFTNWDGEVKWSRFDPNLKPYCHFLGADKAEKMKILEESTNAGKNILNEATQAIIDDVSALVERYKDDYLERFVEFHYFGCIFPSRKKIKIVKTNRYTYKITREEDTRYGHEYWVVRVSQKLDKAAFIAECRFMEERRGYYSKFKHGFLFKYDPSENLE